ncbi:MAG: DUF6862 domain-containing protein, partial [Propionivibrio sp.]
MPENQQETSQTQSVISPANITITGSGDPAIDAQSRQTADELMRRDPATANGSLTNTLTLQQAQVLEQEIKRQQENREAAKLVGAVLSNVVGDLAVRNDWKDDSIEKLALHGLVGLIEAKIGGGSAAAGVLGAISQEAMAPVLSKYLKENGFDYEETGLSADEAAKRKSEYTSLMQLGASLVGTAVGTLATGDVKGASTGADAAFVGVTNNYLKHDEAIRMAALQSKKLQGQCDTRCQQDIDALKQIDEQRNMLLDACQGISSAVCNTVRQDVRYAAAEYIRKDMNAPSSRVGVDLYGTYATENAETRRYADDALDGKALGMAIGATGTVVDGVKAVVSVGGNLLSAAFGDESSQQALKTGASNAWGYVKNPDNWPYLLGAMTPEQREQLAQAYEAGDGNAVGRLMGEQVVNVLSNIPSAGAAGTIKLVKVADKVEEVSSILAKAEKGANGANRGTSWFEDVARNATRNPESDKLVLGHSASEGTSYQQVAAHYN